MDVLSIGFVALMVVLAGVLCYTGDLLGRKLGKKRLTIGRLRPKHTAALMTGLFGGLSALLIVLVLVAVSEPIRTWIVEGNKARAEAAQLRRDIAEKQKLLDTLEGQVPELESKAREAETKLKGEEDKVRKAQDANKRLADQSRQLSAQTKNLTSQVQNFTSQLKQIKTEYAAMTQNLQNVKVNRDEAIKQNSELSNRNLMLTQDITKSEQDLSKLQVEFNTLQAEKARLQKSLDDLTDEYQKQFEEQNRKLTELNLSLTKVSEDLTKARQDLQRAQDLVAQANSAVQNSASALRLQPLLINRGDELSRLPIGVRLNQAEARRLLLSAVTEASDEAMRRGAVEAPGSKEHAIFIDLPTDVRMITADEQISAAMQAMTNLSEPHLLILRSLFNTYRNEFVPIEVQVVPNPVIFKAGVVGDEVILDGSKTETQIADDIAQYAAGPLREKVLKAGFIPSIGRPQAIGEIGRENVLKLVSEVKSMGRRTNVRLIARTDTRAGDVLRLDYRIR